MKKDYKHIEKLLDRFFSGYTSGKEEQELYEFFKSEEVPEHLIRYKSVFNYFDVELQMELKKTEQPGITKHHHKKRWIIGLTIAASLLILILVSPFVLKQQDPFNPYEGSYIIRNGVRITDISLIKSELDITIQKVLQEEEEINQRIMRLNESEKQFEQIELQAKQKKEDILDKFPDNGVRDEVRKIIEIE